MMQYRQHSYPFGSWMLVLPFCLLCGCTLPSTKDTFPVSALKKVDRTVSLTKIQKNPASYYGTLVILGGEVLSAKRLPDHTQLTILHLPLADDEEPTTDKTQSTGRFQAVKTDFLDPAIVPAGTRITIVGEVSGTTIGKLDEMEYTYPVITIEHFTVWPDQMDPHDYYGYPFFYPYGYRPWLYRYPYWW